MKWGALKQNEAYSFPQNINILGFLPILSVTVGPDAVSIEGTSYDRLAEDTYNCVSLRLHCFCSISSHKFSHRLLGTFLTINILV